MLYLERGEAERMVRECLVSEVAATRALAEGQESSFPWLLDVEANVGRSLYLARTVAKWFGPFSTAILLVDEYGIWPSREDTNLLHALRLANGERRPIYMAPGHLFFRHESEMLTTHLFLALIFGWGGLVATSPDKVVRFSHDGWLAALGDGSESVQKEFGA